MVMSILSGPTQNANYPALSDWKVYSDHELVYPRHSVVVDLYYYLPADVWAITRDVQVKAGDYAVNDLCGMLYFIFGKKARLPSEAESTYVSRCIADWKQWLTDNGMSTDNAAVLPKTKLIDLAIQTVVDDKVRDGVFTPQFCTNDILDVVTNLRPDLDDNKAKLSVYKRLSELCKHGLLTRNYMGVYTVVGQ